MDSLILDFGTLKLHWQPVLLSFLCSFFLSSLIAIVYERTFQGLSWSRGIMQSMVLGSIITCLLMIACGVQSYVAATFGTVLFCSIAIAMQASLFGIRRKYDGLVRFQIPAGPALAAQVAEIMQAIPRTFALVTMRSVSQEDLADYTYQVKLASQADSARLMEALEQLEGIRGLTFMNHTSTVEV